MKCPFCLHQETKVIDKRDSEEGSVTRRRRECTNCQKRFTTYEREEFSLMIIKKNGMREQFDRLKIERGLVRAVEKRHITQEQIQHLLDEVEKDLRGFEKNEIKSTDIGNIVMRKLKKLDKVAYIRFASVYREFTDVESFEKELKKLLRK